MMLYHPLYAETTQYDARDDPPAVIGADPGGGGAALEIRPRLLHGPGTPSQEEFPVLAPGEKLTLSWPLVQHCVRLRVWDGVQLELWLNRAAAACTPGEDADLRISETQALDNDVLEIAQITLCNLGTSNVIFAGPGQNASVRGWRGWKD